MGIQAVYIAVKDEEVEKLEKLSLENLIEELEEIQERSDCNIIDIGKIWDGLHFILTGKSGSEPIEGNELSEFIVGTYVVLAEDEFVAFSSKEDVKRILQKINNTNFDSYKKDFKPKLLAQQNIYPNIWSKENKENLFSEIENSFEELAKFYNDNSDFNIIVTMY